MKNLIFGAFICAMLLNKAVAQTASPTTDFTALKAKFEPHLIKKEAPDFTLEDINGQKVSLSQLRGKVVVIDFWATWCKPCVGSFPGMQATLDKYKNDKDVAFLFIDTWEQSPNYKEEVKTFLQKNGYNFHVLFDEMKDPQKATTTVYGVKGIPNKVIIDKNGFIRLQSAGSGKEVDQIVAEMSAKIELVKESTTL